MKRSMTHGCSVRQTELNRSGFTLIELLIVVVIIGILAAIALPKFGQVRENAYRAGLEADLRNLQSAMELYYHNNGLSYAGAEVGGAGFGFSSSRGVIITLEAEPRGWSAVAEHPGATEVCAVFVGDKDPAPPANVAGAIACGTL